MSQTVCERSHYISLLVNICFLLSFLQLQNLKLHSSRGRIHTWHSSTFESLSNKHALRSPRLLFKNLSYSREHFFGFWWLFSDILTCTLWYFVKIYFLSKFPFSFLMCQGKSVYSIFMSRFLCILACKVPIL